MNWNSHQFIWLDWIIIAVGIIAVGWAVYRSVKKHKSQQEGADSEDYLFGKGEPWYIIGAAIFAANIGFWLENSYFDKAAFKPLLHLWSLGLEIQFYLII